MNKESAKIVLTLCLGATILFTVPAGVTYYALSREESPKQKTQIEFQKDIVYSDWQNDQKVKVFLRDIPYEADGIKYEFVGIIEKEIDGKPEKYLVLNEKNPDETQKQIEVEATFTKFPKDNETERYILEDYNDKTCDLSYQKQKRRIISTRYIID